MKLHFKIYKIDVIDCSSCYNLIFPLTYMEGLNFNYYKKLMKAIEEKKSRLRSLEQLKKEYE